MRDIWDWDDPELDCGPLTILRKTWSTENGEPAQVGTARIVARGTVHPAEASDIRLMPEEFRHEPLYLIHINEEVSPGEMDGDTWTTPDEILQGAQRYQMIRTEPWKSYGFWKVWAVRI